VEEAARDARYAALDALAIELGAQFVLTGHTASDQVETVFMRILRGTGVVGLAGIPARRGRYLRPLLTARRALVVAHLAEHGLEALEDPTNLDDAITRNRVRHRWLPALREENPAFDDALLRLARSATEQREVLEFAAGCVALTAQGLAAAPDGVAKRALAVAATEAGAGPLSARHLEDLLALMRRPDSGTVDLALPGLTARREYGELRFVTAQPTEAPLPPNIDVQGDDGPYTVRCWRSGDRMRPQRLRGRSRKLSDLFIDAKVPRELRCEAQVVVRECDGAIVWAEHIGSAFEAAIVVTLTRPQAVATNKK
jgi:tRNA(Ile)-lysidine synthase